MEKRTYAAGDTAKRMICDALKSLMAQKPLDKITVAEIMRQCGMTRQHFYYHFEDIYAAVRWLFEKEAVALLRKHEGVLLWQDGLLQLFRYLQENRTVCLCAMHSISREHIKRFFQTDINAIIQNTIQTLAAQKAELREELFYGKDEKAANPWLFTGVYEGGPRVHRGQPAEDILFEMQSQVILELAQAGPCIIVGRCADMVLRTAGVPVVSLFVCAPFAQRVTRRMTLESVSRRDAEERVRKTDRQRRKYYDSHTGHMWGAPETYDFCVNSSVWGVQGTAEQIAAWTEAFRDAGGARRPPALTST